MMARNFQYNPATMRLEDDDGYPYSETLAAKYSAVQPMIAPSTGDTTPAAPSNPAALVASSGNQVTASGTSGALQLVASGTATDIDVVAVPKGMGSFQTGWGFFRAYNTGTQTSTASVPLNVKFMTVDVDTFKAGAKTFLSNESFKNTSGKTNTYLVNYQVAIESPTSNSQVMAYILPASSAVPLGVMKFAVYGSNPAHLSRTTIFTLADQQAFQIIVTSAFVYTMGGVTTSANVLTVQQIA